jgi:hypothetical protein
MAQKKQNIVKILALAIGLPSSILGVFFLMYFLIERNIISPATGLITIVVLIAYTFFMMVKYANKK